VRYALPVLSALVLAAGCSDPWEEMRVTVLAPPAEGDTADVSYLVEWTISDTESWYDTRIDVFADTDTDPSSGQVMLAESLSLESTAFAWECGQFPGGDYYIRVLLYQGTWDTDDYSDGVLTIIHD
jgi:hypothetical protein